MLYSGNVLQQISDAYEKSGADYQVITIYGGLLDSVIFYGEGLKTTVLKEKYLNEWSSAYQCTKYNKTPAKIEKIIEIWENCNDIDDEQTQEKMAKLLYN